MIKFPSISQFRNVIRHVQNSTYYAGKDEDGNAIYDKTRKLPVLNFRGTTKIHGTNASVVYDIESDEFSFQSRTREVTLESDNAGFALFMSTKINVIREMINNSHIANVMSGNNKIILYGEWCGGNIQKGVAVNGLSKMFVIFAVKVVNDDPINDEWLDVTMFQNSFNRPDHNIYNVVKFGTWDMQIDFNQPELFQNKLIDITMEVEKECPVGKHFISKFNNFEVNKNTVNNLPSDIKEKCLEILKNNDSFVISF